METFGYLVGVVLPPVALVIFLGGIIYRLAVWWKLPIPKITIFPAPEPGSGTFLGVLKATFFFPGLFKGDKALWTGAWVFHLMLAFIFVGHVRVFTDFPLLWKALGINADTMSAVTGGAAGILIMLTLVYLILRRVTVGRVREITQSGDWTALLLILAIIGTGNAMRFHEHFDLMLTRTYFASLVTFQFAMPPLKGWFLMHFLLGQLLFMYLPFSKLLHFGGIFFTQTAIQRR
ncbi:MAG: respiratory nitrate reductase subunit gamma [Pseudomonadota bacterium]